MVNWQSAIEMLPWIILGAIYRRAISTRGEATAAATDRSAVRRTEGASLLQMIFGAAGGVGGYWVGQKMGEAFQRRFAPDDTRVRTWHYWAVGILWYVAMMVGIIAGLETYNILFPHNHRL
jgi:hypothetical protein